MSQQSTQAFDALNRIVVELRSRSDEQRKRAALELRELVEVASRDFPQERFLELYNVVNSKITNLISHGGDVERTGGIYAVDALVDFEGIDVGQRVTRFGQSLRAVLRGKELVPMQPAAVALGKMCRPGGSLVSDLVESEIKTALEWLQSDRIEERRYSAVRGKQKIYDEAVSGVRQGTVESIHGSLLVIKELLQQGGMFMHEHYPEVCEIVFRHKDHRDVQIRKTVVMLIPELANYSPTEFAQSYLHRFMVFLSGEGLSLKSRRLGTVDPVFDCISRLAVAVGQTLSKYMEALLDPIFACELSPKLTQALVDMAFYIPPVKPIIQERLLDMLSKVLCGEPFKPLGAPTPNNIAAAPVVPKDSKDPLAYEHRQSEIKLALNTLGSFDFSGHVLNEFVRDVAIKYVEDENPEIREAAALTCCQLYVRDPIVNQTSHHAIQVVSEVIEKLLTVGVGDPDPSIRRVVLAALDERFDRHLAKAENIRTLFFALNDEIFQNP
ncbi:hypothetical protein DID88_004204 [Monilinia fructigena]|uniref:TATA-binding protein interacting (TIP20) domain-containing protein n=1 Tax=Monilinia fructigena TaxID=38457 RepID=A0A395ISI9_9HELO|nr:hypothetical protein DID88_004204 [Monilinia fructigena]